MRRSKYENLVARMFKKFHARKHGEPWAGLQANIEMHKYSQWFDTPEKYAVYREISDNLDQMSNGRKMDGNVYALFRQVEDF